MKTSAATQAASQTRTETGEFNHKAARVMAERGMSEEATADLLGRSPVSVWRYQNYPPSHGYEAERRTIEAIDAQKEEVRESMAPVWEQREARWDRMIRRVWPNGGIPEKLGLMEIVSIMKERGAWEEPAPVPQGTPWDEPFVGTERDAAEWRSNGLREEVRALLGGGMSQAEIARYLGRSRQIVSYHVRAIAGC